METEEDAPPIPGDRWWSLGLIALLVVPLVVSAVYLWFAVGTDYLPSGDWAVFELRARDVFHQGVFVGPYSRYGWNHPGPLLFYLLGGVYKLLGSRSISLHITALIVNGAALALTGWVAFRRGRLPMVIATIVPVALLTHALGADLLRNPWNPYVPILPLLLLLLLCWSVAVGDVWLLPLAIAVASFAIQSHVGVALLVAVLVLGAGVGIVVRAVRQPEATRHDFRRRVAKATGVSLLVFAVLWFPVFWGTVVEGDGNLRAIADFFTSARPTAGIGTALKVLGSQWDPRPAWIVGDRGVDLFGGQVTDPWWWLAIGLVLGVAATVVAVRRRSFAAVWLAGLLAVAFPVAVLAVGNIIGTMYVYLTRWTWVLGTGLGILVLWGAWLAVPPARRPGVLRVAAPVAGVIVAVLMVMETVDALDAGTPFELAQAPERSITEQVIEHLPAGPGPVLLDLTHGGPAVAPGIALALERRGIPVEVRPGNPVVYGSHRDPAGGPYRAVLAPVSGYEQVARAQPPPGPVIARYVVPETAAARRRREQMLEDARALPPGKERRDLIRLLEGGRGAPTTEIVVYLEGPPG